MTAEAPNRRFKSGALLLLFLALGLFVAVIAWQGWADVKHALALAGWGLLVPAPLFLLSLIPGTLAWWVLFPEQQKPRFGRTLVASWMGSSVNWLLPVAQVGGELARALWLSKHEPELKGALVAATTVVDKTLQAFVQALVGIFGVVLLVLFFQSAEVLIGALVFSVVLVFVLLVFVQLQRGGFFQKLAARASKTKIFAGFKDSLEQAEDFDKDIAALYSQPRRLLWSLFWRTLSRLALALELWWILWILGIELSFFHALLLESLGQTVRAASFLIPGSYGVQEGSFVLLGKLLNISGEFSLTLSLGKRVREFMVGLPALLLLQATLGFGFLEPRQEV